MTVKINSVADYPPISLVLTSYNHESYIEEAINGAFSQDYANLQIIISDDCSTDKTYDIILKMVSEYSGRHEIRVRRNVRNLGIGEHINQIFKNLETDIVVFAAGDDVSLPNRVSEIYRASREHPNAMVFSSAIELVPRRSVDYSQSPQSIEELLSGRRRINGCAAAYKRSLFLAFGDLESNTIAEDAALTLRALLLGGEIADIKSVLVKYRTDTGVSRADIKDRKRKSLLPSERLLLLERSKYNQWKRDLIKAKKIEYFKLTKVKRIENYFFKKLKNGNNHKILMKLYINHFGIKRFIQLYFRFNTVKILHFFGIEKSII